jgi:hypothetical protein
MNSLKQDLKEPLDRVQRAWIRKPVTLLFIPFAFIIFGICCGAICTARLVEECWGGDK